MEVIYQGSTLEETSRRVRGVRMGKGKKPSRRLSCGALQHKLHLAVCPTLGQRNWAFRRPHQTLTGSGWGGKNEALCCFWGEKNHIKKGGVILCCGVVLCIIGRLAVSLD